MTPLAAATQIGGRLMTGSGAVMHALLIDGEMANHGIDHTRIGMTQGHRSIRADQSSTTISSRGVAREHQTEMFPTKGEELTNGMSVSDAYASCHLTYVVRWLYVSSPVMFTGFAASGCLGRETVCPIREKVGAQFRGEEYLLRYPTRCKLDQPFCD